MGLGLSVSSASARGSSFPGGYHFKYRFKYPRIAQNLLCIHRGEGSWSDQGSPYWGGLQMDLSFQQTYGPHLLKKHGTADHWPVVDQLIVGIHAVLKRGYGPWLNTARNCGLL